LLCTDDLIYSMLDWALEACIVSCSFVLYGIDRHEHVNRS